MINYHNVPRLSQEQITEVTTELNTILKDEYKEGTQKEIVGLKCICPMPGIVSERVWLFLYKGALVLLHDLGNNYYSYVGCLQEKMDNILLDHVEKLPRYSFERMWALEDLDCNEDVSYIRAKEKVEKLNMENDLKEILDI